MRYSFGSHADASSPSLGPAAGDGPVNLRRLLVLYLLAIAIVIGGVFVSLVATQIEAAQIARAAQAINVNGRQRMLTQRIAYLAQGATLGRIGASGDLEDVVTQFEMAHADLTGSEMLSDATRNLYFSGTAPTLDDRILAYAAAARDVIADPAGDGAFARLSSLEQGGLLESLEAVVAAIEAESVARVLFLRNLEAYSLILAVVVVLLEVAYIFIPGHRLIRSTLEDLEGRNTRLIAAQTALTTSFAALEEELATRGPPPENA